MSKWLKIGGGLLVVALLATVLASLALAQSAPAGADGVRDQVGAGMGPAWGFVDEDGDGINDRYESGAQFVDENGDGICDLCGAANTTAMPRGRGYRMADGTAAAGTPGSNLANPAYVDENGDGVCDYYGGSGQQRMMGRGRWAAGQ